MSHGSCLVANRFRLLAPLLTLLLTLQLSTGAWAAEGAEQEPSEAELEEEVIDLLPTLNRAASPDESMSPDQAEFVGNPANTMFSWWPEDLVLVPIPGRTPEFGWSIAAVGGYFLDLDKPNPDTPNSIIGGFGWYSENKSWAAGAAGKFNLLDDKLRVNLAAGYLDVNYKFYGIGNEAGEEGLSVRVEQAAPLYFGNIKYQFFPRTYLGIGYFSSTIDTRLRFDLLPPEWDIPALGVERRIAAIGVPLEIDTRDHEQFPRAGWHITANTMIFRESVGSDVETETVTLAMNNYRPMRKRDVLAWRFTTRATGDDAPFYLLSTFGGRTDLRGYESGRYRDRMMYAAQAEYRWQPHDRWIITGFAGVGEVAPSYSEFFKNFLPAAGIGGRFVLSQKHKLNLSLDVAVGKHGAEFYFGVGEAF